VDVTAPPARTAVPASSTNHAVRAPTNLRRRQAADPGAPDTTAGEAHVIRPASDANVGVGAYIDDVHDSGADAGNLYTSGGVDNGVADTTSIGTMNEYHNLTSLNLSRSNSLGLRRPSMMSSDNNFGACFEHALSSHRQLAHFPLALTFRHLHFTNLPACVRAPFFH
jgi:hypothetical protein